MSENINFLVSLMQEILFGGWLTLISMLVALVSVWVAIRQKSKVSALEHQMILLRNEIRALNSGTLGIGKKVRNVESELANAELRSGHPISEPQEKKAYEQAAVLLERGATIEEVSDCCDLPPAEVELLAVMHHSGKAVRKRAEKQLH